MLSASTVSAPTTRRCRSTPSAAAQRRRPGTTSSSRSPSWQGTLDLDAGSAELTADATSLRVRKGTGGMQALGDEDKANIHQTIDDEVLKRQNVTFRSTRVERADDGGRLSIEGDLTLAGTTQPIAFDVAVGEDGTLHASAVVTQTRWGMKPYSALFGALKVLDDVEVVLEGHL